MTEADILTVGPAEPSVAQSAVSVRGLTKRYGSVLAVDGIDLDVPVGSRFGLLGPNGSGKTTLVRMLLGLVFATSGDITVLGQQMPTAGRTVLPKVGALVEGASGYSHLSGRTNLRLLDAAGPDAPRRTRKARVEQALESVGLAYVDNRPVRAYSLGMRQRLGLAAALLHTPALLLLDEPTNGLDPTGIRELRELLVTLNEAGTTVVLSSHLLSEVEALCGEVALLDQGRLVFVGPLEGLRPPTGRVIITTPDVAAATARLAGVTFEAHADGIVVVSDDPAALNTLLVAAGVRVTGLVQERRSLEDVVTSIAPGSGR